MAKTSKNNIYYNDDENSIADVLTDMKELAESVDEAIENVKYDDKQIKQNISNIEEKNTAQDKNITNNTKSIEELKTENETLRAENKLIKEQIPSASASGNSVHIEDSGTLDFDWKIKGGHKQENREGYQLLESYDFTDTTINNLSCAIKEDGKIVLNGTPSKEVDIVIKKEATYKKGTYTFVINQLPTNAVAVIFNSGWQTLNQLSTSKLKGTFTLQEDAIVRIHIYIRTESGNLNNYILEPLLYEGEYDENKAYEQYGASPSPDYPSEIETVNGSVEIDVVNKNLVETVEREFSKEYSSNYGVAYELLKKPKMLKANKIYAISLKCKSNKGKMFNKVILKDGNVDNYTWTIYKTIPTTYTIYSTVFKPANDIIVTQLGLQTVEIYTFYFADFLIEEIKEGSTSSDYIEHQSQTAIMPIQQEMLEGDYVADVEHHEWGKLVLTGDEGFVQAQNANKLNYFYLSLNSVKIKGKIISNMLKNVESGIIWNKTSYDDIVLSSSNSKTINIMLSDTTITTLQQFKEKLKELYNAGTPIIIYYELAEAIDLELTEEQKAVRDTKLYTYKNITNISLSDELASIDVTYKKDLETEHNKLQKEIDEIKQLISTTETSGLLLDNLQKDVESEVE